MTPEGLKDLAAVIAEMRDALVAYQMDVDEPPPYKHRRMIQRANRLLALLLAEARLTENKEVTTRVDDTQYGAPLGTAAENQTVPATCALCGVSIHRYGVRLVRLGDGTWICADCFYQQRDVPKG